MKTNGNTFSFVSDINVEKSISLNAELKIPHKQFLFFLSFMNTYSVFLIKQNSNYIAIPYALAEVWISTHFIKKRLQKHPLEEFYKKAVLKYFTIYTGKHLCWSLFSIKLQVFRLSKLSPKKISLWNFFNIFSKKNFSQVFSKKAFLIFRETELSSAKNTKLHEGNFGVRKVKKKKTLWKYFLYFRKWNFRAPSLKNFLSFLVPSLKNFLYFGKELAKPENQNFFYFFSHFLFFREWNYNANYTFVL